MLITHSNLKKSTRLVQGTRIPNQVETGTHSDVFIPSTLNIRADGRAMGSKTPLIPVQPSRAKRTAHGLKRTGKVLGAGMATGLVTGGAGLLVGAAIETALSPMTGAGSLLGAAKPGAAQVLGVLGAIVGGVVGMGIEFSRPADSTLPG